MKTYYAIQHIPYGMCCDEKGNRICAWYLFKNKKDRDNWVAEGQPYTTSPGYREAIKSSDVGVKRVNRAIDSGFALLMKTDNQKWIVISS
jgi:hypothetical protein